MRKRLGKGLDAENAQLAKNLLVSALAERAKRTAARIMEGTLGDPSLPKYRDFALGDLKKAVKIAPQQPEVLFLLAQLTLLGGREEKSALPWLDDAIRYSTGDPLLRAQALTLRAELQKDPGKKVADLSEAIRLVPGDPRPLRARAAVYMETNKLPQAEADLKAAIELAPDHGPSYEDLAIVQARLKHYDQALKNIERARQLDADVDLPRAQAGANPCAGVELPRRAKDLDEAIAENPDHPEARRFRATIYAEMDKLPQAEADLKAVIELSPNHGPSYAELADVQARLKHYDQALKNIERARHLEPKSIYPVLQQVQIHAMESNYRAALNRYPPDPSTDFIKRVVGLPGDLVELRHNQVFINGQPMPRERTVGTCRYNEGRSPEEARDCELWIEILGSKAHKIYQDPNQPPQDWGPRLVPPRSVFVMGDNRDNSRDSRVWGFVPYDNVKGRALVVWWSRDPAYGGWSPEGVAEWFKSIRLSRFFSVVR